MDKENIKLILSKHAHFTNQLQSLIQSLLIANNVKYHIIESRTKDLESLGEKIEKKQIKDIKDITDLSGIRIIVYYQDDIDRIEKIVKDNFRIDLENSIDKSKLYKSNEFGYLSVHYIITLNQERENLTEWKSSKDLKAELQVRTVLQHSWASISHELSYKKDYEIPKQLERKLFRLAGLFELADEQFLDIREKHQELFEQLKESDKNNEFENENINSVTLSYAFQEREDVPIFNFIEDSAFEAGFRESENDDKTRFISEVNQIAKILKLKTIQDFYNVLEKNKAMYPNYFQTLIKQNEDSEYWYGDLEFYVGLALMLEFNNDDINVYEEKAVKWNKEILRIITDTVKEIKKL